MPRTVEEILQHADELAARFESYEPNPADELDTGAVALLRAAVAERSQAERHLIDAIRSGEKYCEGWHGATSSMTAVLGRMATGWENSLNSGIQ